MASGCPLATCWPSETSSRVTGPLNGDSTTVAWSLSKSTVPGAAIVRRNAEGATVSIRIWPRWAAVSLKLPTGAWTLSAASFSDEQPASSRAPASATIAALLRTGGPGEIGPVPPAAAQGLEQGGGVGEAVRFGLDQGDPGLLIGLLGVEQGQIIGIAVLVLEPG